MYKEELFLRENNKDIFVQMMVKFDVGLNFRNLIFKSILIKSPFFFTKYLVK